MLESSTFGCLAHDTKDGAMYFRRVFRIIALLVIVQVVVVLPITQQSTEAQTDNEVMVLIAEKSRDACEVQDRRSDSDNWGASTIEGPWVPCEGGLVTAYRTTPAQADALIRGRSTTGSTVKTVPLTGNTSTDAQTVQSQVDALHQAFDPEGSDVGFMSPETMDAFLGEDDRSSVVMAAGCKQGQPVGTWRKREFGFKAYGPETTIRGYIKYKRISCKLWQLKEVRLWMNNPATKKVWFQDVGYSRVSYAGGLAPLISQHCKLMTYGTETGWSDPWWEFQAKGQAEVKVIDEHHLALDQSCWTYEGTTYSSLGFRLPGGTK